jgi:hypothetical protein
LLGRSKGPAAEECRQERQDQKPAWHDAGQCNRKLLRTSVGELATGKELDDVARDGFSKGQMRAGFRLRDGAPLFR